MLMSCGWWCVQVHGIEIIAIAKNVCDLKKQEADRMLWIDIMRKATSWR
jgi:hypothetical protein